MTPDRLSRVAEVLASDDARPVLERLLDLVVELLPVDGVGVAIVRDGEHHGAVAVTNASIGGVDELQFELGEGPCIDAGLSGAPVLEPDLTAATIWPAFVDRATAHGVGAVFSFPMRVGAIDVGVLSLYRRLAGDLAADDVADALAFTLVATHLLLDLEDAAGAGGVPTRLGEVLHHRREVHQATGMVAAQLGVDTAVALSRLRAHAWVNDRAIHDVALEVVDRTLRFEP